MTYREQYLLFNEATGTTRDRENVIATIAHEFAVSTSSQIKVMKYDKIWVERRALLLLR